MVREINLKFQGFERLVTPAPLGLINVMKEYMKNQIFNPAIGGTTPANSLATEEQVARQNDLHKRRKYLTAFCKLFAFRMIELRHGAEVFMHYLKVHDIEIHSQSSLYANSFIYFYF